MATRVRKSVVATVMKQSDWTGPNDVVARSSTTRSVPQWVMARCAANSMATFRRSREQCVELDGDALLRVRVRMSVANGRKGQIRSIAQCQASVGVENANGQACAIVCCGFGDRPAESMTGASCEFRGANSWRKNSALRTTFRRTVC